MGNQWLKGMNGGLFDYTLFYNSTPQTVGDNEKNGNIGEIHWQVLGGDQMALGYRYDNYNRLTQSFSRNLTSNISNQYNTTYIYDPRGNFSNVIRRDQFPSGNSFTSGIIDNLQYNKVANSNRLSTITESPSSGMVHGAQGSSNSFAYDANGNMTTDPTKDAVIEYNHLNLPRKGIRPSNYRLRL